MPDKKTQQPRFGAVLYILLTTSFVLLAATLCGLLWLRFGLLDAGQSRMITALSAFLLRHPFLFRLLASTPGLGWSLLAAAGLGGLLLYCTLATRRVAAQGQRNALALLAPLCGLGLVSLLCGAAMATGLQHTLQTLHVGPGGISACHDAYALAQQLLRQDVAAAESTFEAVMRSTEGQPEALAALDDAEYISLAGLVCLLVEAQDGIQNERQHYFRNYFARAPETLEEMVHTIQGGNSLYGWALMPLESTLLHMNGPDGLYNLKFVSEDGHFEAVYDRSGALLLAENSPEDMGTFNYASPLHNGRSHYAYDVAPYYRWNNVPGMPPVNSAVMGQVRALYARSAEAQAYREHYENLLNT